MQSTSAVIMRKWTSVSGAIQTAIQTAIRAVRLSADKAQISGREDSSREDSKGSQKEKLLILKDSFANSFIPYILGDFEQITMLDTRYYRGNIAALSEKYDRVLLLYSITSLAEQKLNLTKTLLQ